MSIFALTSDISPRPFNVAEVPVATSRAHSYWALRSFTALARTSSCPVSSLRSGSVMAAQLPLVGRALQPAPRRQKPRRRVRGFCLMSAGTACSGGGMLAVQSIKDAALEVFGSPDRDNCSSRQSARAPTEADGSLCDGCYTPPQGRGRTPQWRQKILLESYLVQGPPAWNLLNRAR